MNIKYFIISLAVLWLPFTVKAQTYSLAECKEMAIKNNVQMKNKQLDVEASKEVKKAAYTKYFPQVSATAMAYKFTDPLINMEIPGGNLPVYDGNPANLATATEFAYFPGMAVSMLESGAIGMATATQPLYAGGRITTGNKLANIGIEVNELQLVAMKKAILLETEKQYWQIVSLGEKKKTLENYINLVDALHNDVANALEAGLITRNDLLKVELKQNELQMNLSQLTNGTELAKMAFCQYTGIEYNENINFTDDVEMDDMPGQYYTDHSEALRNREEYMMLQKSSEAEKYMTKMQRGEYLPQAAVGAGALYLDIMDDSGEGFGMVFGTLSIPISGWWEAKHKMKERRLKEEQNLNVVNDTNEKLLLQMQQEQNMLSEAYKQVQLAKTSIEQAEENLRVNQNNYEAGMVNVSDMLEAQAQLQQSRNSYTDALSQYRVAKVNYLQVTGR
jgi:outer membrane protein TolC